jgi:hypothetical protein
MVYRGKDIPELVEGFVFGDWGRGNGHLFVAYPPILGSGHWKLRELQVNSEIGQLLGIGQDADGELYLLSKSPGLGASGNSGVVYKIVPRNR